MVRGWHPRFQWNRIRSMYSYPSTDSCCSSSSKALLLCYLRRDYCDINLNKMLVKQLFMLKLNSKRIVEQTSVESARLSFWCSLDFTPSTLIDTRAGYHSHIKVAVTITHVTKAGRVWFDNCIRFQLSNIIYPTEPYFDIEVVRVILMSLTGVVQRDELPGRTGALVFIVAERLGGQKW